METKTVRNTTYTVTDSRRGWKNDRTVLTLRGPRGGEYSLVEFDSGARRLTDFATGRTTKWHSVPVATSVHAEVALPTATFPADTAATLRRSLAKFNAASERWAARRAALPVGSSRARVTTANAQWMIASETRDRFAARLYELTGEIG